jgi:hypothetical protein
LQLGAFRHHVNYGFEVEPLDLQNIEGSLIRTGPSLTFRYGVNRRFELLLLANMALLSQDNFQDS